MHAPTVRDLLDEARAHLERHGVPNAARNAQWMLCRALECTPMALVLRERDVPDARTVRRFRAMVARRAAREPLQFILGTAEFMSLEFEMARGVFVPRPETEELAGELVETLRSRRPPALRHVLDLCCGSGVIGVAVAVHVPGVRAWACDVDAEAVRLARRNAERLGVGDRFVACRADAVSVLDGIPRQWPRRFDAIACNPPYVPSAAIDALMPEVRDWDPRAALDGGVDGLDLVRALAPRLVGRLAPAGVVRFEIGDGQGGAVARMLRDGGLVDVVVRRDLAGRERVVAARAPAGEETTWTSS